MTPAERIAELESRVALLERALAGRSGLYEGRCFHHRFRWVWPALKNTKRLIRNSKTGRMAVKTDDAVTAAVQRIRLEIAGALRTAGHARNLPLFPADVDVGRQLAWNPEAGTIDVTWWPAGPKGCAASRKRDLVNLGALLDDAVGRDRIGRRMVGEGLIYRDDAQVAEVHETRIMEGRRDER